MNLNKHFLWGTAALGFVSFSAQADVTFLGVAAGDASSSDAIVWTRAADAATSADVVVTAQLASDPAFATLVASASATALASKDYTVKFAVTGLAPGSQYYYRFVGPAGEMSVSGTFKTAPDPVQAASVRFAFSGDGDGLMRPYPLASVLPAQGLDFFVFLGDTIYETASSGSVAVALSGTLPAPSSTGATQAQLYSDYARKYREQLAPVNVGGQSGLLPLFLGQGNYTLLDNHELGNRQYINGGAAAGGPVGDMPSGAGVDARDPLNDVNVGPSFINKSLGFQTLAQVYLDHQPIKERDVINTGSDPRTDGTRPLFFAQRWGRNAMFINADDRSYRDIRLKTAANADDTGPRAANAQRTILGATQFAWLQQTLLDAQAAGVPWKFIAVSAPIDQLGPIGGALAGVTNGGNTGYAPVASDGGKSWMGGYRAERNALLKFIADHRIYNVVFLSTDDHQNRVNELTYSPAGLTEDQTTYVPVPHCFSIVDGPIGATGPELVTNHTFLNNQLIASSIAAAQAAAGVNPIGLDPNYPGLHSVVREGDPSADSSRQAVDFYSPDTFNFNTLDVSADGTTLTVTAVGLNSYPVNSRPELDPVNNPARAIFSFAVDAFADPAITACPDSVNVPTARGHCSAVVPFSATASGRPAPAIQFLLNGAAISSPFEFPKGVHEVTCLASNGAGVDRCSFTVTVTDAEAPAVAAVPATRGSEDDDTVWVLLASDNCDAAALQIFVKDSAQGACGGSFAAGPFAPGTRVQLSSHRPRATAVKQKGKIAARITTIGRPVLVVTDSAGNTTCKRVDIED